MDFLDITLTTIALLAISITLYLVWTLRRLRYSIRPSNSNIIPIWKPIPKPKCYVRTYNFSDGHIETKHSLCHHLGTEMMTDKWAESLHSEAQLQSVTEVVHYL